MLLCPLLIIHAVTACNSLLSLKTFIPLICKKHPKHKKLFTESCKYFDATPGFPSLLRPLISSDVNSTKGYVYEIEKAVEIAEKSSDTQKETVVEFHVILEHPKNKKEREIDLRTTERFIECKNVNWSANSNKNIQKKIRQQLLDEKELVKQYNATHGTGLDFILCSKQPISKTWKHWLDKNKIAFEEG